MVATKEKAKTAKPGKNPKEEKTIDESVRLNKKYYTLLNLN